MVRWGGWSAAGAAAPLSFGEEGIAVRQCHGQLRAPRAPDRIGAAPPAVDPPPNYSASIEIPAIYGIFCLRC